METYKYFLPLGSVIKIKKHKVPVMIIKADPKDEQDYLGVNHPLGFSNDKTLKRFSIDDIEEVYFLGYQNKELHGQIIKNNIEKIKKGAKK
jgi:hypothetical protein